MCVIFIGVAVGNDIVVIVVIEEAPTAEHWQTVDILCIYIYIAMYAQVQVHSWSNVLHCETLLKSHC